LERDPERARTAEPNQSPYEVAREIDSVIQRLRQAVWAVDRVDRSGADTLRALTDTYRDPESARREFLRYENQHGADRATYALRDRPEQFGSLLTVERRRFFGLWRWSDDRAARVAAAEASVLVRERAEHVRQSRDLFGLQPGASAGAVRGALDSLQTASTQQLSQLRQLLAPAPTPQLAKALVRDLGD
jgi:hypothetical protein